MRHVATFVVAALLLLSVAGPVAGGAGTAARGATATADAAADDAADPAGRWIVLYKNGTDAQAATENRAVKVGFRADHTFTRGLRGFSAKLSDDQVEQLRHDPAVAAIIPDEIVEVAAQTYPTGISRIGARLSQTAHIDGVDQRVDADVAVLDTGIAKVADLNVVGGHDCSTSNPARWRDVYGHGTHVAGTIGAIDNGSGVVGVAPGVRAVGGQGDQRQRLGSAVVVRLRHRLGLRPARSQQPLAAPDRGREHEHHEMGPRRRQLRRLERGLPPRVDLPPRQVRRHGRRRRGERQR